MIRAGRMYKTIIENGFQGVITKVSSRIKRKINDYKWQKIYKETSLESKFTQIYTQRLWTGSESVSGFGSGLEYTKNLRINLQLIIEKFEISTILDLACGDCNWIKSFFRNHEVEYLGCDIVKPLIEKNRELYGNDLVKFEVMNVVKDELPSAELVICRDLLFHLPNREILKVLSNICRTESRYLLLTSHIDDARDPFSNVDIEAGDFRRLDLFREPFCLPRSSILAFDDWMEPDPPRIMVLYNLQTLRDIWLTSL